MREESTSWRSEYDSWASNVMSAEHESSRARAISVAASNLVYNEHGNERRWSKERCTCCGDKCTGNAMVLILSIGLFSTITAIQFVAAWIVGSKALMADCASMLIDALSYCGNLLAECLKKSSFAPCLELIFSGSSIVLLVALTLLVVVQVIQGLLQATVWLAIEDADPAETCVWTCPAGFNASGVPKSNPASGCTQTCLTPQPWNKMVMPVVVLGFALLGILFDGIDLAAFALCHGKDRADTGDDDADAYAFEARSSGLSASHNPAVVDVFAASRSAAAQHAKKSKGKSAALNMLTALLHVGADLMRSTTTFIESIVMMVKNVAVCGTILGCDKTQVFATLVDSIAALVVSAIILVAVIGPVFAWIKQFCTIACRLCRGVPLAGPGAADVESEDLFGGGGVDGYRPPSLADDDAAHRSGRTSTGVSLDFGYDPTGILGAGASSVGAGAAGPEHARVSSFNTLRQTDERLSGMDLL